MKKIDSIPTQKVERVAKLLTTGVKIGGNYIKYYGEKLTNPENAQENLHKNNAEDIYATAWATNINESSCIIRLKRFTPLDKKQSTNITVNFIAIGKGKPTS
jgi:hypothetical protein